MDGMDVKMEVVEVASEADRIALALAGDEITITISHACARCGVSLPKVEPEEGRIAIRAVCAKCRSLNKPSVS